MADPIVDSPLADRWLASPAGEQGARLGSVGDIKAVTIHMAEGGGTASWLSRLDGNSSHYVVEYTGAIVQMVRERNWAGSINPRDIRTTNDSPFVIDGETVRYGRAAQLTAVGITAAKDPNRYVIAIEVEGFAKSGPNEKQRASLKALVNDIRLRRGPLPCLGHRDWQDYKACPGKLIHWGDYGGHAVKAAGIPASTPPSEDPMPKFLVPENRTLAAVKNGAWLYESASLTPSENNIQVVPGRDFVYVGRVIDSDARIVAYETAAGDDNGSSSVYYVNVADIELKAPPAPPPVVVDCTAQVNAAVASAVQPLKDDILRLKDQVGRIKAIASEL
jgi:hypothetical protein